MQFEIAIEGRIASIKGLESLLKDFSPRMEPLQSPDQAGRGRILILESEEDRLNGTLSAISGILSRMEGDQPRGGIFDVRVRNLAYSEPSTGSEQFEKPFSPISSLTIQPWRPETSWKNVPGTVVIDPHNAFGTGKHPTTRLCLEIMEEILSSAVNKREGLRVLDFGCGTGLLALAAVKMGATEALGVEIDPSAARAANRNVALNSLASRIRIQEGSWQAVSGRYDLVLANLVAAAIIKASNEIPFRLKPKGLAVVSGFGENRIDEMERLFLRMGLIVSRRRILKGWGALEMRLENG